MLLLLLLSAMMFTDVRRCYDSRTVTDQTVLAVVYCVNCSLYKTLLLIHSSTFIHSCIYLRILIISYFATFLCTNNLSAVKQSINQSEIWLHHFCVVWSALASCRPANYYQDSNAGLQVSAWSVTLINLTLVLLTNVHSSRPLTASAWYHGRSSHS